MEDAEDAEWRMLGPGRAAPQRGCACESSGHWCSSARPPPYPRALPALRRAQTPGILPWWGHLESFGHVEAEEDAYFHAETRDRTAEWLLLHRELRRALQAEYHALWREHLRSKVALPEVGGLG